MSAAAAGALVLGLLVFYVGKNLALDRASSAFTRALGAGMVIVSLTTGVVVVTRELGAW